MHKQIALLALIFLFIPYGSALSCTPTVPRVGTIQDIQEGRYDVKLILEKVYTFEPKQIIQNKSYSIDAYNNIIKQYQNNQALPEIPENIWYLNETSLPRETFERTKIEKGDLLIKGPPSHVCDYGLLGIFSSAGDLKYLVINSDFLPQYLYEDQRITITPGKNKTCNSYFCEVNVNFALGKEEFTLAVNQSHTVEGKRFTLLTANNYIGEGINSASGIGDSLKFIIAFTQKVCPQIPQPIKKENCEYLPIYEESGKCVKEYKEKCPLPLPSPAYPEKNLNIFQKFINWIKSFFR